MKSKPVIDKKTTKYVCLSCPKTFENHHSLNAEEAAKLCEKFGEVLPINCPDENISRKSHSLVFVFPKFIREQNLCYKMLKLEQAGEKLHSTLNELERLLCRIKNKETRYWILLKEYENLLKTDFKNFRPTRKRTPKKTVQKGQNVIRKFRWKKK